MTADGRITWYASALLWSIWGCGILVGLLAPATLDAEPSLPYRLANGAYWVSTVGLLVLALRYVAPLARAATTRSAAFYWLLPIMASNVIALALGLVVDPGEVVRNAGYFVAPYAFALVALIGAAVPRFAATLPSMLLRQLPGGILLTAFVLTQRTIETRADFAFQHHHAFGALFPIALLLPLLDRFSFRRQVVIAVAAVMMIVLHIVGQNRLPIVTFGVVLPVLSWFFALYGRRPMRRWVKILAVAVVAGAFIIPEWAAETDLMHSWEQTLSRAVGSRNLGQADTAGLRDSITFEYQASRGAEAWEFVNWAGVDVWLVGAGAGAGWPSMLHGHPNWPLVHFGPLNLILRGGIVLAIGFLGLYLSAIWNAIRAARWSPLAGGCAAYLIVWFFGFLSHGLFAVTYSTCVLWLVLGVALGIRPEEARAAAARSAAQGRPDRAEVTA